MSMSERKTYMGRPNFPSDDRAAGDLGREHRLNVKTFSAVVLGDMPAAASSVRAAMSHEYSRDTATPRLRAALDRRMLLIILQAIDGWSVQLARAVLARAQGATKCPFLDSP